MSVQREKLGQKYESIFQEMKKKVYGGTKKGRSTEAK